MAAAPSTMLIQIMEKFSLDVSKNSELKSEVDALIANGAQETCADYYWPALKLALLDSSYRIIALNSIQRLIAHVLLVGKFDGDPAMLEEFKALQSEFSYAADQEPSTDTFYLIDEIILIAAQIAFKQDDSASVQLQVIKLFLTIVTAETLHVHSFSLLLILKVCFLIHSSSHPKSTNDVTSKGSLTQMINCIFIRMEKFPILHGINIPASSNGAMDGGSTETSKANAIVAVESEESLAFQEAGDAADPIESDSLDLPSNEKAAELGRRLSKLSLSDHFDLLKRDARMTLRFLCMFALSSGDGQTSSPTFNESAVGALNSLDELPAPCIKDRTLALEFILSIFENLGHVFRRDPSFFVIVKENLLLAISRNSVTTNPSLFELSLSIFLLTIRFYRHLLKLEIEVQLGMYLQILELGNSTYKQKSIILQGLLKICESPQTLMDIYLNYDCEFEMSSIYEKLISICSRITQGRGDSASFVSKANTGALSVVFGDSKQELVKQQDRRLQLRSLCILTAIIQSLVSWTKEIEAKALERRISSSTIEGVSNEATVEANPVVVGKNPLLAISMRQSSSVPSVSSEVGESENDKAEQVASKKQLFRRAMKLFATSPKKGMKAFIAGQFVEETVPSIASFLSTTKELNKASIGDFIGEGEDFNIKVMHAFIDMIDFSGFNFVDALRHFLQTFRLPGEAQKIDRIMEKFADRYCELNPSSFAKADTAYTLAFSVIMLNTDQHSSQIKHRMNKSAFIKNNRGINDDGDLPDEFLGSIFDEIASNEIIMEDERSDKLMKITLGWGAGEANEKKRREIIKQELSLIQKKTQLLMTEGASNRTVSPFRVASDKELTRSMFSTCSWALMAALSVSFESSLDDAEVKSEKASREPNIPDLCLSGFSGAICLSCIYNLETERDAFVSSLAKLTGLLKFQDMKSKNIKAIATLIEVATNYGEFLETAWPEILKSLSLLEKMQESVHGENVKMIENFQSNDAASKSSHHFSKLLQTYADEVQSQDFIIVIDRIFTNSVKLSAPAIISFFKAVCQISLDEVGLVVKGDSVSLANSNFKPRMYLLQKIIEIAHYNMHRIRFEWTQIWRILQPHFNRVASHPNLKVANFAVDSLRQLGTKFLEREELGQFSSQHEFLKSFEWIIKHNQSPAIRELILSSLSQLINARASKIRSGWKSIFVTLAKAAQTDEKLATISFQAIQIIFREHFEEVVAAGGFVDLVSCLAECALLPGAGPVHDELVMSSIQMLQSCNNSLMERVHEESPKPKETTIEKTTVRRQSQILRLNNLPQQPYLLSNGHISEEHFYLSWFPILSAFSRVVNESEGTLVRTHTMEILFETLKVSGKLFEGSYWKSIYRNVIAPIFEELHDPEIVTIRESNSAVMILGLRLLVQTISNLFPDFSLATDSLDRNEFLQSSVDTMVNMMTKTDAKLASTGQTCFSQFLGSNAEYFGESTWGWVIEKIEKGFRATLPSELVRCQDYTIHNETVIPKAIYDAAMNSASHIEFLPLDGLDFEKTIIKCITHLEFLSSIQEFCFLKVSSGKQVLYSVPAYIRRRILDCMYSSYVVARVFNSLTTLRHAIYKRGWVAQLPNLVKQETTSLSAYILLLFASAKVDINDSYILDRLAAEIFDLFSRFNKLLIDPTKHQRDINSWNSIIVIVFRELSNNEELWMDSCAFKLYIPKIYKLAVKMIGVERYLERPETKIEKSEMKLAMIDFFEKIGTIYLT